MEIKAKSAADYGLTMTENAAKRIKFLVEQENQPVLLRVAVLGGGCSGFQYSFSLDEKENPDDLRITRDEAVILIDDMSVSLLQGSEVDFYALSVEFLVSSVAKQGDIPLDDDDVAGASDHGPIDRGWSAVSGRPEWSSESRRRSGRQG